CDRPARLHDAPVDLHALRRVLGGGQSDARPRVRRHRSPDPAGAWRDVTDMRPVAPGAARVFLKNPLVRAGAILSALLLSFSLIGPVLPLPDPYEQDILHRLDSPTRLHW